MSAIGNYSFLLDSFCHPRKNTIVLRISPRTSHADACKPRLFGLGLNRFYPKVGVDRSMRNNGVSSGPRGDSSSYMGQLEKRKEAIEEDDPMQAWILGKFIEGGLLFRQNFIIRSYEIGPHKTVTIETLMNLLQEIGLNHGTRMGVVENGLGATREMTLRKLIWVIPRMHVQVNKYSSWGDVVEINTWIDPIGKYGLRRDWIVRDHSTRRIIAKATSTLVVMNSETRGLCKIPNEVQRELESFYLPRHAFESGDESTEKIKTFADETADVIRSNLTPRWNDMDANQHVNHVKYVGLILESVPLNVMKNYDLTSLTLEYRRECIHGDMLESLTSMKTNPFRPANAMSTTTDSNPNRYLRLRPEIEGIHSLRMQDYDKAVIVRATTKWHSKIVDLHHAELS